MLLAIFSCFSALWCDPCSCALTSASYLQVSRHCYHTHWLLGLLNLNILQRWLSSLQSNNLWWRYSILQNWQIQCWIWYFKNWHNWVERQNMSLQVYFELLDLRRRNTLTLCVLLTSFKTQAIQRVSSARSFRSKSNLPTYPQASKLLRSTAWQAAGNQWFVFSIDQWRYHDTGQAA